MIGDGVFFFFFWGGGVVVAEWSIGLDPCKFSVLQGSL